MRIGVNSWINRCIALPLHRAVLVMGMVILAAHPVAWLVRTWYDPSYDSQGFLILGCFAGLLLASMRSTRYARPEKSHRLAIALLLSTALIRLASELLAIHVIGALALVVDVYAIALLLGVQHRRFALSPFWLAVLFSFALPLEHILQRVAGYGLQHLSAQGACMALQSIAGDVVCHGVRILIAGKDVLVDLPCSGARSLLLLLILYAALMAWTRPSRLGGIIGLSLTLFSAFFANTLRITLLALGLGFAEKMGGIDVMAEPWHDMIGLLCLGLAALPILGFARHVHAPVKRLSPTLLQIRYGKSRALMRDGSRLTIKPALPYGKEMAAFAFLLFAVAITQLPGKPLDVSAPITPIGLPESIDGFRGETLKLLPKEQAYFTQYGGSAVKTRYGQNSVMVVRTSSPLRHLHAPDECMRGLGFQVQYQGLTYTPLPTAIYKVTGADGTAWRVGVSFRSDQGRYATSVAEAVWSWMQTPGTQWTEIQRISPWRADKRPALSWDRAVMSALDLGAPSVPLALNQSPLMENRHD